MKTYFKIMTWLYLIAGISAAGLTVYFQVKGMRDEAIYSLVCVLLSGVMLGLRNWQKKRMANIEALMRAKQEAAARAKGKEKK